MIKSFRPALTVLELTFVIVVIGIVASIAIPKLSASRQDAQAVKQISNLANCLNENLGYIVANNPMSLDSSACVAASDCFTMSRDDSNGSLNIEFNVDYLNKECLPAKSLAIRQGLMGVHSVGYKSINL